MVQLAPPKKQLQQQAESKQRRRRGRKGSGGGGGDETAAPVAAASKKSAAAAAAAAPQHQHPHGSVLISLGADEKWYNSSGCSSGQQQNHQQNNALPERNAVIPSNSPYGRNNSAAVIQKYRNLADNLYRREVQLYMQKMNHNGGNGNKDDKWVEATMRKGTLKDRIAAMSVVVSTDPIHKFYALDGLLQMTGCHCSDNGSHSHGSHSAAAAPIAGTNSRVAQLAAEALEDLFLHTFLPPDRKLVTLAQRPLMLYENESESAVDAVDGATASTETTSSKKNKQSKKTKKTLSPRILLLWRFEEMVKEKFDLFLRQYLAHTLHNVPSGANNSNNNSTSTSNSSNLERPKIGALRTAAALLRAQPEAEAALLQLLVNKLGDPCRKTCAAAAHELRRTLQQHPAMQATVAREVQQLAHRPHLSAAALYHCITFLNQLQLAPPALPATAAGAAAGAASSSAAKKSEPPSLAASLMSTYFRLFEVVIHQQRRGGGGGGGNDNKKRKHGGGGGEKKVAGNGSSSSSSSSSRLLSALLQGVNRAHPYLPAADQGMDEHVDALYRVVHTAPPGARTQSLLLLFHLAVGTASSSSASAADYRNKNTSSLDDDTTKAAVARKERFYRALYSTLSDQAMLGAGKHLTMYFNLLYKALKYDTDISRLVAFAKRIWSTALHCTSAVTAASIFLLNEVGKAHPILWTCYTDVLQGADALRVLDPSKREPRGALVTPGELNNNNSGKHDEDQEKLAQGWELSLTMHHFHPSVQKFARSMGQQQTGEGSSYSGDPLKDFALAPFLDKFAYRNPKSVERVAGKYKRGQSVGERRSGTDSIIQTHFSLPVNDPSFLVKSSVDAQDEFFHKFFVERARRDTIKGVVRNKPSAEEEDKRQAELDALDREEVRDTDQNANFGELESQWETDEEEEAFVDSLAQKIIEDAMDGNLDELEDEDPDTQGWDDMDGDGSDDDDDDGAKLEDNEGDDDSEDEGDALVEDEDDFIDDDDDDDAFMDNDDDSNDSDDADELDGEDAEGAFFADQEGDDSAENSDGSDDHAEDDLAFAQDGSSDDDEAPQLVKLPVKGGGSSSSSTFAAAEDYEELIAKSWSSQNRPRIQQLEDEGDDSSVEAEREVTKKLSGKKKNKKRKKHR